MPTSPFVVAPPVEPMLAKLATTLPVGEAFLYEPKWDGFRAIVFCGGRELFIHFPNGQGQSRLKLPLMKSGTARNLNTVRKLAAMAGELA